MPRKVHYFFYIYIFWFFLYPFYSCRRFCRPDVDANIYSLRVWFYCCVIGIGDLTDWPLLTCLLRISTSSNLKSTLNLEDFTGFWHYLLPFSVLLLKSFFFIWSFVVLKKPSMCFAEECLYHSLFTYSLVFSSCKQDLLLKFVFASCLW